jgi:hypothetical protein
MAGLYNPISFLKGRRFMHALAVWFLVSLASILAPANGAPAIIFVPHLGTVEIPLPKPDFSCHLIGYGRFIDMSGCPGTVDELPRLVGRKPGIIIIDVDLNTFSAVDMLVSVRQIRNAWNPKVSALIIMRMIRFERKAEN